jgi:coproporphyrinogen III oxidase-like Fe-S oxidoreductase
MVFKTLFDLSCQNFDYYFANHLEDISPQAKDMLPKDVAFKIFRGGGKVNTLNTSKLSFVAKLYILCKCLRKRWYIVVEDEHRGLSPQEFLNLREQLKKRVYTEDATNKLVTTGEFVYGSKELMDTLGYLNTLSTSKAYTFLAKNKNPVVNKSHEWSKKMQYIVKFILTYEANKKTWVSQYKIEIPEWYVLISLYEGQEVKSSPIHQVTFRRAYQSSPTKIRKCFAVLQSKGLISKTGDRNGTKLRITALGVDLVNTILEKYALNF